MAKPLRTIPLIVLAFGLSGCADKVVIQDGEGGISLTYSCPAPQPRAVSQAEHKLVRSYALRIVNAAAEGDIATVRALEDSEARGDWQTFESTVIRRLLDSGRTQYTSG